LWVKGFGYFGDQGAQGAFLGYDSKILGGMIGFDAPVSDDTRAGLGVGYARSTIKGKSLDDARGINTYQATAYIAHDDGTWFGDGDLSYGWNSYSGMRHISFSGIDRRANAKYSGEDFTGLVTAGRHFAIDDLTVTPLVSLQASSVNLGGYTETGAGDINLQVAAQNYSFVESGLGMSVAQHFALDEEMDLLPEIHVKWLHELLSQGFQNIATFTAPGSTSFVTSGLNAAPDTLNLGAGFTLMSCACSARTWSIETLYDYYWRSGNYSANQVMLAGSYRF
jgi:outer membrane autotransporter protein